MFILPHWSEQDLLDMIASGQEEFIELDFKRALALANTDRNKAEISKDVSAFANTIGGTILYGIAEGPDPPHQAFAIDPIDPGTTSKEWLEQIINSRIQPRVPGVLIRTIAVDSTARGKFVYCVLIPESVTAHQASDNKYYKRHNFESLPMQDYEVRQAMGRSVLPAYKLELMVAEQTSSTKTVTLAFQVIVTNISELLGENCSIVLYAPAEKINVESFDNGGSTEINGERYLRLLGPAIFKVFPGRPEKLAISAKASYHELIRPVDPIHLALKMFDSHGLALSQTYTLRLLPRPAQVELAFEEPLNRKASIGPP
jgi:hypothetical protein